ncbi:MAG: tRNA (N(6)-L-threonylcarbamoyladenosine(37)-C(2))-methylthiotransferase MtaB [Bacteroidetes bacterium]|nr:tRNA (N(6)-L-threonylcarbamoyladenosine(37)-C(2))-methylthiotransferase MtaB [Bacteroidota bacterium]
MKKVAFHTLGCKLNFAETSTIARKFEQTGYTKVDFAEQADVYVLNTCSVTENADKECKQLIRTIKRKTPQALVAVIGCYAQLKADEIGQIEGVDLVLGAKEKFNLPYFVEHLGKQEGSQVHSCEIEETNQFVSSYSIGDRTRSFLKVQDGCDYTCSYCTIPLARGKSRSDSIESVIAQANEIALSGVKEIVLTGVNIGDFGFTHNSDVQKKQETFLDLIKQLDKIKGISRFRISSIEPNLLKNEIIDFVAASTRFTPHFHVPLQSGSNAVLKRMHRRYMRELYVERVAQIKKTMPHACIGADVLVGFPGESENEFLETYHFLNQIDVSYLHVFTYSERPNTEAANLAGSVPMHIRKERNKMLRILSAKKQHHFYQQHKGSIRSVLFETENKNGWMHGFTDNYIKVQAPFVKEQTNTIHQVCLQKINENGLAEAVLYAPNLAV